MTRFNLAEGEMLHIEVSATEIFNRRVPEILDALVECSALVNQRYIEGWGSACLIAALFIVGASVVSSTAPANNGMHPTADTLLVMFQQSCGAAGDAGR